MIKKLQLTCLQVADWEPVTIRSRWVGKQPMQ